MIQSINFYRKISVRGLILEKRKFKKYTESMAIQGREGKIYVDINHKKRFRAYENPRIIKKHNKNQVRLVLQETGKYEIIKACRNFFNSPSFCFSKADEKFVNLLKKEYRLQMKP